MPYTALPDRRIPYDNDGTVMAYSALIPDQSIAYVLAQGLIGYFLDSEKAELNDPDFATTGIGFSWSNTAANGNGRRGFWLFFPEQREVTAAAFGFDRVSAGVESLYGSNDTTNGVDGTWETASFPNGIPNVATSLDGWRSTIKAISFTGGKRMLRWTINSTGYFGLQNQTTVHLYGEKVAGQTPDDVIYIDHDTTPGVEYTAPEDFGDQPLGTTVVRQFRLKNTSTTKTANSINVQCNDSDFAISTDGTTWVVTISIASLGPGAQSATMYVRCTTPAPGNLLGPRFARIVTTVASYT